MVCVKREYKVVYRWTTDSLKIGDSIEGKSTTTDYNSLGKNHFLKHEIVDNKITASEACFIYNGNMHCLKWADEGAAYETNKALLLSVFGESVCDVRASGVYCGALGVGAYASSTTGLVIARAGASNCYVPSDGYSTCVVDE